MGVFGEMCADKYEFSREQQDAFAIASIERAQRAMADGSFIDEITAVTVTSRRGESVFDQDEEPPALQYRKDSEPASRRFGRAAPSRPPTRQRFPMAQPQPS